MSCYTSPVFWQIQNLVETLSKKTLKSNMDELYKLVGFFGNDAEIFLVSCLLARVDIDLIQESDIRGKLSGEQSAIIDCLVEHVQNLSDKSSFGTAMQQALALCVNNNIDVPGRQNKLASISAEVLESLCNKVLKLSTAQQVALSIGLSESTDPYISKEGAKLLVQTLFGLMDSNDKDLSEDNIANIVWVLRSHEMFLAEEDLANSCMVALESAFPETINSLPVAPLLVSESRCVDSFVEGDEAWNLAGIESAQDLNLATVVDALGIDKILFDFGCACTHDAANLTTILTPIYEGTEFTLDENDVARVLSMMAKTQSQFIRTGSGSVVDDMMSSLQDNFKRLSTNAPSSSTSPSKSSARNNKLPGWNVQIFVNVAKKLATNQLDAEKIVRKLEKTDLSVETLDATGFELLVEAFNLIKNPQEPRTPFPAMLLLDLSKEPGTLWRNPQVQMALVYRAVFAPPEIVSFGTTTRPLVKLVPGVQLPANGAWLSLDLIATLDALAGNGYYTQVKALYEAAAVKYPECLLLGLLQLTNSPYDALREETYAALIPAFLQSIHKKVEPIGPKLETFKQVWAMNHFVVLRAFVALYALDGKILPFIVELVRQQPEALKRLLALPLMRLALDVACYLSRLGEPTVKPDFLELWLNEKINAARQASPAAAFSLARSIFVFVQYKLSVVSQPNPQPGSAGVPVAQGDMNILVKKIAEMVQSGLVTSGEFINEFRQFYERYQQFLKNGEAQPPPAAAPAGPPKPQDVLEQQANAYFQMLYKNQKTIPEILDLLVRFKNSDKEMERNLFNCMIHNLFDEYKFLHKYPEKELQITAVLYGSLINLQIVTGTALGIVVKFLLDALSKPVTTVLFRFGYIVLSECKNRIKEMSNTVQQIVQIPHLRERHPEMVAFLEKPEEGSKSLAAQITQAVKSTPGSNSGADNSNVTQLRGTESDGAYARVCERIDELIGGPRDFSEPEAPTSEVEDEWVFLINQLTQRNVDEKVAHAQRILTSEYLEWIAFYLVVKRVKTQANFHSVYVTFLERIGNQELFAAVKDRTLLTVRELLRSNDIVSSSSQRVLLKNLGSWLGRITLGRNKPLLHRDVDLKSLLVDGYERGWLIAVVPFAAKILDGTKGSTVFVSTNPWQAALLGLFAELYDLPDLKLNLKFEIEVLCKNLSIDLKSVMPSDLLNKCTSPLFEGNPDFNVKPVVNKPPPVVEPNFPSPVPGPMGVMPNQQRPPLQMPSPALTSSNAGGKKEESMIPNLASYVNVNGSLTIFQNHPNTRRFVALAVDRAIREIIQPVVERSVTIACMTTRELVLKDFAMEPDEKRLKKAAHMMVSSLAGSLALVTCKDPLRSAIVNALRSLMQQANLPREDQQHVENAVQTCASDNVDIGCMLIEKATTEKAMRDIDELLEQAVIVRKDSREKKGQPYFDTSVFTQMRLSPNLSEQLRPVPNPQGLPVHQLMVYESFQKLPRAVQPTPRQQTSPMQKPEQANIKFQQQSTQSSDSNTASVVQNLSGSASLEKWRACIGQIDRSLQNLLQTSPTSRQHSLRALPRDHEIFSLLRDLKTIGQSTIPEQRDEAVLMMTQRLFKRLYDIAPSEKLTLEIQFAMLEIFRDLCKDPVYLRRHLTEWVMFAPSEHRLNIAVPVGLLRSKLLVVQEIDAHVAKLVENGRNSAAIVFAMDLIQECILVNRSVLVTDFLTTLDSLQNLVVRAKSTGSTLEFPALPHLLDNVRSVAATEQQQVFPPAVFLRSNDPPGLREQVAALLRSWLQICSRSDYYVESVYAPFLTLLQSQGALKGDENAERFFRITTELCVEYALTNTSQGDSSGSRRRRLSYLAIDAFSKLVVLLVKYAEPRGKTALTSKVLDVVCNVLRKEFVARRNRSVEALLDQRPYFRLLLSLQTDLTEFYESEGYAPDLMLALLRTFADAYHRLLSPSQVPVFAFSWLELVSHNSLMPRLLKAPEGKGWLILERLLVEQLRFMYPYLRETQLTQSMRIMYKGTLRVLLVLLHDFPEFLCSFHISLSDAIPHGCVQLRNLILSAFPRTMQLPDPFTPDLKTDGLPECHKAPRILSNYVQTISDSGVMPILEQFLKSEGQNQLLPRLKEVIVLNANGERDYNISLLNSIVLYAGLNSIAESRSSGPPAVVDDQALLLFRYLALELDFEGRYYLFSAMTNQLRFPNSHTHYFSSLLLFLFLNVEVCQEQITRVLLERLIVHRPHPWGLLTTFIELIKNPKYAFWDHSFTQCAPEIRKLFESVAKSCMANSATPGVTSRG